MVLLFALLAAVGGCRTAGYYSQAVSGHLGLLLQREPVEAALGRDDLPADIREALTLAKRARQFAQQTLELDASGSYESYVALERRHVVWNVFAAPPDSLNLLQWCFPVAGCVGYRGYFSQEAAKREAARLEAQGLDVFSGGVDAYSTLGWFNDPLTTPMLRRPRHSLAALIFHELAHQRVYLPGDTVFNESLATFVEQEGLRRWHEAGPGKADDLEAWEAARRRQAGFVALVEYHSDRLAALYAAVGERDEVKRRKAEIISDLRGDYESMRTCWGVDAYGGWFAGPLNNAQLATVGAYHQWVPAFAMLMHASAGDWGLFHDAVAALAELPEPERLHALESLLRQSRNEPGITPPPATPCVPRSS